jgi:hypothetical protein
MKVIIKLITEFSKIKSDAYILQMTEWFFVEGGKYDPANTLANAISGKFDFGGLGLRP